MKREDAALTPGTVPETLLEMIVREGRLGRSYEEVERGKQLVTAFVQECLSGGIVIGRDLEASIRARIAQIDHLVSAQTNEILHHPDFQSLEATWRGLAYLVREAETSSAHRIFVLNASKREISRDIDRAADFLDIDLYRRLSEPLEALGGEPFGCIIAAYEFGIHPIDVHMMEALARMGSLICAPVLTSADMVAFGLRDDGALRFGAEDAKCNRLRMQEYARFLVLVLPRMLLRLPYGRHTRTVEEFDFEEWVDGTDGSRYLWGNPAWALAARISAAWTTYGWCAAIQSREGGGLVRDLPLHWFRTNEGDNRSHPTTEVVITERMETQLFERGLCSLCQYSQSSEAVFPRVPTFKRPARFVEPEANWNDRFGVQLPFVLACCRFALAIRIIVRDNRGVFNGPEECEEALNNWLSQYVLTDENAAGASRAAFPMREARIVVDRPYQGERWVAALFLRPDFQLDGLTTALRVALELPIES